MNQTSPIQKKSDLRSAFENVSRAFQAGDMQSANRQIEALLADYPDNINFLHLGGLIKQNVGELDLAEKLLATAFALRPEQADIMHNLAVFYLSRGKLDQALPLYEQLTALLPQQAPVWLNYGHTLRQQGKLAQALEAFLKTQQLAPHQFDIEAVIAMTKKQCARWDDVPVDIKDVPAALAPVFLENPKDQLVVACKAAQAVKPIAHYEAQAIPTQSRVRVGYLSNDLHEHATSHLVAELFSLHDRSKVDVFVYSYGTDDGSKLRQRMKAATEHWVECNTKPPAAIAERIFRDRINILVDMKGYTRGGLPEVMAARPANVNMQWLGYPATMGADFIDYIVADQTLVPPHYRDCYTEKLLAMPHSYQINDRQRPVAEPLGRAAYGLPEDALVLACFCQPYKITPPIFDVWMNLLRDTPRAVLWLFATHADAIPNLQAEAEKRGINKARLIFAARASQDKHLARYRAVDLVLDTSPYGGHTTTSDALWAGAPVVALMGQSFAARVSASLLNAAGLSELVAQDVAGYENKIRYLINAHEERARLKAYLADKGRNSPLFDTPAFVAALENAYEQIWQKIKNKSALEDIVLS